MTNTGQNNANAPLSSSCHQIAVKVELQRADNSFLLVTALLDTGSPVSLISSEYIEQENIRVAEIKEKALPDNIFGVMGTPIPTRGAKAVKIKFGKKYTLQKMLVTEGTRIPTPVLLGTDFMLMHAITLQTLPQPDGSGRKWKLNIDGEIMQITCPAVGEVVVISRGEQQLNDSSLTDLDEPTENEASRCKAVLPQKLPPSVGGYVTLVTPSQATEALFEPNISCPRARMLFPGIVKLNPSPDPHFSFLTVPFVNVEVEGLELDDTSAVYLYRLCTDILDQEAK